ncbi:MAG: deoxyribonuclease [Candidatus Thiodiazotropha sp. (ex Myrtea spinifera)]|nr:deoxyribonuclease [Candidatus Thiodiazotropha sp. (ex Myrtea spinifera)]
MTTSDSRLSDDFSDVEELQNKSGRLRVLLEITVAILLLVGIYYLFAPEEAVELPPLPKQDIDPIIRAQIDAAEQQAVSPTDTTDGEEVSIKTPVTEDAVPQPSEMPPENQHLPEGAAAREIIADLRSGSITLNESEMLHQAQTYQQAGALSDAYLLLFYAAKQGGGQAAFDLASLHDPNHFSAGSSLLQAPDTFQAHKWYSRAASQNIPQAEARMQALRSATEKQAETGDMAARRLLLNWQ